MAKIHCLLGDQMQLPAPQRAAHPGPLAGASALADATKVDAYASRPGDARAKHAGFFLGGRKTNSRNAVAGRGKRHQNGAVTAQPAAGGRQAKWAAPVRKPRRNHKAKL